MLVILNTVRLVGSSEGYYGSRNPAGFEIRGVLAMREHYVRTIREWARTLDGDADRITAIAGVGQLRVWRLYLAGVALAFEENRMGVNQILAQRHR